MNKSGLTQREIDSAKDGEVQKGCLILTEEEYEEKTFYKRSGSSLQFAFMPEVEFIADSAFQRSPLTAVCFLKVRSVSDDTFRGCEELIQIFLPVCEELGKYCFDGCKKIKILDLPKTKRIGSLQFWDCSSLTDLIIPSVEEIGENCFYNCDTLESIDSKLDADQFRCTYDLCKEEKKCIICRGQLQNCLKKGKDQQNRQRVQKKMEEQKLVLLKDAGINPIQALKTEDTKPNVQIQQKTKDEQIEDLTVQMQKKDEQIEQIFVKLQNVEQQNQDLNKKLMEQNQQHQQEINRLIQQQQLNMEKMELKFNVTIQKLENSFDIKVERMVRKFENLERENEELRNEFKNFVRLLADK